MSTRTIDMPAARSPRWQRIYRGMLWLLTPALLAGCALGSWWLDRWSLGVAFEAYLGWQRVLANAAVGFVAILLLASLTRRLLASVVVVAGLQTLVFVASSVKLGLLGMPVVLQDAYFITGMISGLDLSGLRLLSGYVRSPAVALAIATATIVLLGTLFWLEPPWCRVRSPWRWLAMLGSTALVACLYFAAWPWTSAWYDKAHIRPSPLGMAQGALHGGIVANMVYVHGVQRHQRFEVDANALRTTLRKLGTAPPPATAEETPPDVVLVLSESFMDPRIMKGMDEVPDLIPSVRAQLDGGNGGELQVPTFGGGTVRTEFEVLTGMPVDAFPTAYYPYVDLNPSTLPGLASVLKRDGYATVAIHGNSGAFWNRTNTYEAMGIDRFITQRDFVRMGARQDGNWWQDSAMTDIVLGELGRASSPTLIVAISIENHGPYNPNAKVLNAEEREGIALPATLDAAAAAELRAYLYHLKHADREFERLHSALNARGRPYVLLFFGDHLPALATDAYQRLSFVDGRDARAQFVPWVLVGNTASLVGALPAKSEALYAWELPGLVLRAAGNGGDGYFRFIDAIGPHVDPAGQPPAESLQDGLEAAAHARLEDRFDEFAKP